MRFILYALELDGWAIELINGNPPKLPYIIDPACGSGTFLLESMKLITQSVLHTNKGKLSKRDVVRNYVDEFFLPNSPNKNVHNKWARTFIYGIDDNEDLATATKVNMILHGDGNANILKADGLADFTKYALARMKVAQVHPNAPYGFPINEQFDCLVSNPPFSLKEEARTLAEYGGRFAYAEQKNSENLFIERWYQLLKEGGRMGVVLPDSVFDTNENLYIRMFLYRFFWIRAVVSLPQVTFQPYTPTKTSLLFAVKKTRKEVEQWDDAWRKAAGQYKKMRESPVVTIVHKNERIRNSLADFAARIELEWYPSTNLLNQETLSPEMRKHFIDACASNSRLVEKLKTMLQIYDEFVSQDIWSNFSEREPDEARETLKRLLRGRLPLNTDTLSLCEFVEAVYDEILLATAQNYTQDPKGQPYCNAWWIFSELTTQKPFDYEIFFAEAENVGYKRTTRHPEGIPQPNDLFQTNADGNVTIDTENPKKISDYLRSKKVFFCHDAKIGHFSEKVSSLCRDWFLRLDVDYVWLMRQFIPFLKNQKLKDVLLAVQTGRPITKADYADEPTCFIHIVVRNIRGGKLELTSPLYITEKKGNELRFYGLRQGDIVMAISSTCGHSFYLSESPEEQLTLSHYTARLVSNTLKTNPQLLTYYINSPLAQSYFRAIETGKAQKNLSKININYLPLAIDCSDTVLLNKILAVEANVEVSFAKLRQPADIINEILCGTFGYPLDEHQKRERERVFTRRVGHLGTGSTLRSSVKFHHPGYELTDTFFARVPHKRIKLYLAAPIRLGITITREGMDDEGEAYYVHPNALRSQGRIDLDDCHRVTMDFYERNKRRGGLRVGDVLIARSGEGTIGKTALFDLDEPCIFSDFTMRLRFNNTMNPKFAIYFFRSVMFQSQVEREKRGMGNMTNIFPSQVEQFLSVDCPRAQQDTLAAQITAELEALEKDHEKIEAGRQEIQKLIEAAITKVKAV